MNHRLDIQKLFDLLGLWDGFFKRKVRLIACGGTALTLQGIKSSTKDVDFLIPEVKEYEYLIKTIQQLGYRSITGAGWRRAEDVYMFDLYQGKSIHTTELLESPLEEGNHIWIKELQHISIGSLNHYDLIISKLFRGSGVDIDDCLMLFRSKRDDIHIGRLENRYAETARYDVSEDRVLKNWDHFKQLLKKEQLI